MAASAERASTITTIYAEYLPNIFFALFSKLFSLLLKSTERDRIQANKTTAIDMTGKPIAALDWVFNTRIELNKVESVQRMMTDTLLARARTE